MRCEVEMAHFGLDVQSVSWFESDRQDYFKWDIGEVHDMCEKWPDESR